MQTHVLANIKQLYKTFVSILDYTNCTAKTFNYAMQLSLNMTLMTVVLQSPVIGPTVSALSLPPAASQDPTTNTSTLPYVELSSLACRPAYGRHMLRCQPSAGTSEPYRPHKGPSGLSWEFCNRTTDRKTYTPSIDYLKKLILNENL